MQPNHSHNLKSFESHANSKGWGDPDMSVIDGGRREPPSMPSAMFGEAWDQLKRQAVDKGAPIDYTATAYLIASASVIGGKRRVRPYRVGDWSEPAILWAGLVGDPSSNKSPALKPMTSILRKIEADDVDAHRERLREYETNVARSKASRAAWEDLVRSAHKEDSATPLLPTDAVMPDEPRRRRLYVGDTTQEAMAEVLAGNPQGTLLLRDELSGWLTSFDRYNTGGSAFWLEAWNGERYTVDRKGRGAEPLTLDFNGCSILGGIQPAMLAEGLFGKTEDGMSARFLWVWPNAAPFARPSVSADAQAFEAALRRLEGLAWAMDESGRNVARVLSLDHDAEDAFECIQRAHRAIGDDATGLLKSFVGKLDGIALRLCLTVELSRWAYEGGNEPASISRATVEAVGDFLHSYAIPMAHRVYGDAVLPQCERNAATLARHIKARKLVSFNGRDVRRLRLPGLDRAETFNEACDALCEANWLRPDGHRSGDTPGRKSSDYLVNPALRPIKKAA